MAVLSLSPTYTFIEYLMNIQHTCLRVIWLLLCLPLFVLFIPQALYVKRTTIRLPDADGKPFGKTNTIISSKDDKTSNNDLIRLLHVGESTVAGVGVEHLKSGFTVNLAASLSEDMGRQVFWSLFGENGIRVSELKQKLTAQLEQLNTLKLLGENQYELAVVTMGVNDSTKFTSVKQWRTSLEQSIKLIRYATKGPIFFTQVPPLAQFPALPAPLKYLLGLRSTILDTELKQLCDQSEGVFYLGSSLQVAPEMMAIDGYHPSELGYQHWARQISPLIAAELLGKNKRDN
jgi:lysophospholipase L1-like esterase